MARNRSETCGNDRESSLVVVMEGNEEIVVRCEKYDLSVYRRMTDLSPPPFFNFDCPQSIEHRVLNRGSVDMQMNSESRFCSSAMIGNANR